MSDIDIDGPVAPGFEAVRDAFAQNFADDQETGAGVAAYANGTLLFDIRAGLADRRASRPWTSETLAPIYSTTKAIGAVMIARAVEAGSIDYDKPIADYWPEFAQAGKDAITVAQGLSHQGGLCGFADEMPVQEWKDWDAVTARIAAMAPLWPPGTRSGYHPQTLGLIAGEIYARACGKRIGDALTDEIAAPAGLDVHIGLKDGDEGRLAQMVKPAKPPSLGELNPYREAAFLKPWASAGRMGDLEWMKVQSPAANGFATAGGLARFFALAACGEIPDTDIRLSAEARQQMSMERIAGDDLVLPFDLSWGAGVIRNTHATFYGPSATAFGHSGWGGSCVFADPDAGLSFAYVMNRMSSHLAGDPRPARLIEALYRAL